MFARSKANMRRTSWKTSCKRLLWPWNVATHTPLQVSLLGHAIAPGEPRYDELRAAWNLTVDQHPALIVVAESAADIAAAVQLCARGQSESGGAGHRSRRDSPGR